MAETFGKTSKKLSTESKGGVNKGADTVFLWGIGRKYQNFWLRLCLKEEEERERKRRKKRKRRKGRRRTEEIKLY